jgi:maltooligosyltrehalose synthase
VAFARLEGDQALVVAVPRAIAAALAPDQAPTIARAFAGTALELPAGLRSRRWRPLFGELDQEGGIDLGWAFSPWPVTVLASG